MKTPSLHEFLHLALLFPDGYPSVTYIPFSLTWDTLLSLRNGIAFLLFFVSMMPLVGMTDTYNQIMSSDEKVAYMIQNNPFEEILNYSKLNNI